MAGAIGKQRSGKGSRISINSTVLNLGKYEVDYKGDDLDTTNFETGGAEQGTIGVVVCEFTFGGFWDAHVPPYGDPPGLFPRDNLVNVLFYTNLVDNVNWAFPTARILSAKNSSDVRGLVLFDASGKSQGTGFTIPSTAI